ncbi:uncharacterized protein EV154DRAFT_412071 [Mucor mucedo]|uniref:uncharacterized protein n=1 Tax=Mucor mucedo TaxID=29922 RepID=UPI00221FDD27|nr:uncharacterized protein EV154DRAFT_412071 [Mucor mucedo]KAI7896000.1 hypothetical protein EV154DRAFT_412071 [Mucor mucedo]
MIREFILTVERIRIQYEIQQKSLEQFIHQLDEREQSLDQGLAKIGSQQKELERRQVQVEQELQSIRLIAENYREKKKKREQEYSLVASVPILSAQSKKRYIKARNKYSDAEQQVSESRQALEKCRDHLRLISKTVSAQYSEQDRVHHQRRGSKDTLLSSTQQLDYLQKGCDFWSEFDSYQAQLVLESAIYLREKINCHTPHSNNQLLDMDQVWQKTFLLACFEYGDGELYAHEKWNVDTLQITFDCEMCQTSQTGWPKVAYETDLVCQLCYSTIPQDSFLTKPMPRIPSHSKMRKLFSTLFNTHSKVNPI